MTEKPRPAKQVDTAEQLDSSQFQCELRQAPLLYRQWMLAGNPAYFFDRIANDFGDFVHYRGLFGFYLINHPTLVKQVLKETNSTFDKRSLIYDRFRNVFGDGLVVAEGERWKRQRKTMQPMFGPITVRRFFSTMINATNELANDWEGSYGNGTVFDVAGEMEHLTLKIAGQALFSDGFDDASDKIAHWTSVINHYSAKPPLPIIRQFWFPSSINRRLKQALREFHQFIHGLIADRRKAGIETANDDLLGILLQAKNEDDGKSMPDGQIAEEVLGMIIGGHETSSRRTDVVVVRA